MKTTKLIARSNHESNAIFGLGRWRRMRVIRMMIFVRVCVVWCEEREVPLCGLDQSSPDIKSQHNKRAFFYFIFFPSAPFHSSRRTGKREIFFGVPSQYKSLPPPSFFALLFFLTPHSHSSRTHKRRTTTLTHLFFPYTSFTHFTHTHTMPKEQKATKASKPIKPKKSKQILLLC